MINDGSLSFVKNGKIIPVVATFAVTGEEPGVPREPYWYHPRGYAEGVYGQKYFCISPRTTMRLIADVLQYTAKHRPTFDLISISGHHRQEAGADAILEQADPMAGGLE